MDTHQADSIKRVAMRKHAMTGIETEVWRVDFENRPLAGKDLFTYQPYEAGSTAVIYYDRNFQVIDRHTVCSSKMSMSDLIGWFEKRGYTIRRWGTGETAGARAFFELRPIRSAAQIQNLRYKVGLNRFCDLRYDY